MKEKIGEHLIKLDLLSFEQAEMILSYQKKNPQKRFGEIAVEFGFLELDKNDKSQYVRMEKLHNSV